MKVAENNYALNNFKFYIFWLSFFIFILFIDTVKDMLEYDHNALMELQLALYVFQEAVSNVWNVLFAHSGTLICTVSFNKHAYCYCYTLSFLWVVTFSFDDLTTNLSVIKYKV